LQEAEDLGFQISLLKRFVENMKSEGFDFSNLLNEIRASMKDKRSYERTVQELSVKIKKLGEEKKKAEREIDERSDIISKMDDDIKQKNESIKSLNPDLKILNENISKNKDELTGLEQLFNSKRKDLKKMLNGEEFAKRGISTLKDLEERIRRYRSIADEVQNRMYDLEEKEKEKRNKIEFSEAFYDLIVYASDNDRRGLKLVAEEIFKFHLEK